MTAQPISRAVTAMQVKDLTRRVDAISYQLRNAAGKKATPKEPATVKAARKLVAQFDARSRRAYNTAADKVRKRCDEAKRLALYGSTEAAIRAVEKLEAEARKP